MRPLSRHHTAFVAKICPGAAKPPLEGIRWTFPHSLGRLLAVVKTSALVTNCRNDDP
jgi:hypothetical protein